MPRKEDTRDHILERAAALATQVGLTGLTIGGLAACLNRPKSTVAGRFRSKEWLQIGVLEFVAREFIEEVVRPALREPAGLPRLRLIVLGWLVWGRPDRYPLGGIFPAAAAELDDQPGPVRDRLVRLHRSWQRLLKDQLEAAIQVGALPPDTDLDQVLQEIHGILLACHMAVRLSHDGEAERRARRAFARMMGRLAQRAA